MKTAFIIIASNLTSIACAVGAAVLAFHEKDGWWWFLLVALLVCGTPEFKKADKSE